MNFTKGEVIAINKPLDMTSFSALAFVRKRLCMRLGVKKLKVGHAGTLDPLATGVLVLCTGKFTKRIEEFQQHGKEYTATLQLGATTPSYDMEHPVNETYPTDGITRERIEQVLERFKGDIEQVPPTFSACKVSGQRAYDVRRKGEDVELQPKKIRSDDSVRQGHIHTRFGTRHRSCARFGSISHAAVPHPFGRVSRRRLPRTGAV